MPCIWPCLINNFSAHLSFNDCFPPFFPLVNDPFPMRDFYGVDFRYEQLESLLGFYHPNKRFSETTFLDNVFSLF